MSALGHIVRVIRRGRVPFIAATWLHFEYHLYWKGNTFLNAGPDIGKFQIQYLTQRKRKIHDYDKSVKKKKKDISTRLADFVFFPHYSDFLFG